MTTSTQWYLDSIDRELADLPADERADLLEDLAAHFSEFDNDDDLVSTLGDPAAYARELRDAAGLSSTPPLDTHVPLVDRVRANIDALRRSAWWRAVAAFLPELRPAWWVLRAWLIVAAIAIGPPGDGGVAFPIPRVADNMLVGLVALMLVVPVSVMLGLQARRGQRKGLNVALTAFGALFFVVLPASADNEAGGPTWTNSVATTVRSASTTRTDLPIAAGVWVTDSAGNSYRVIRINSTPSGHTELQALCPVDVISASGRAQRSVDGDAIACVGELPAGVSPPAAPTTTVPPTTAPTTTTAGPPVTTISVAPTVAPSAGTGTG